ncbi:hypothetical protein D9757_011468 [Collybiopsis confluens]|uniref:Protein kinase domain-containing protein n=1 Tax=Collybiopsis confluens TaxID=2823264 RepID=A0A8H5LQK6_9AGAR|nr:hypothetical protein D9757_011468 [Collybiopsis confluens]
MSIPTPAVPPLPIPELTEQELTHEVLLDSEVFWGNHYDWLKERGYLLRPRYRPGWVSSWVGSNKWRGGCEDFQALQIYKFNLDATRLSDGMPVMLRRPDPPSRSNEVKITQVFSSASIDRRNHCAPIYETISLPEPDPGERNSVVIMPFLVEWNEPEFETVGEVVDFCTQVFEGLEYIHSLNVAHNDAKFDNIMMDWSPLYAHAPHPFRTSLRRDWSGPSSPRSRTLYPVKYYFIDWDLSELHDRSASTPIRVPPGYGGDQSVPEFQRNELCDPFAVDVYCLGNVFRTKLIEGDIYCSPRRNVDFLKGLISDMTHDDPAKRPTMSQVVTRFEKIRKGLWWWKLRSRVSDKNVPLLLHWLYSPIHWAVQLSYIVRRIPAIPDYTRNSYHGISEV